MNAHHIKTKQSRPAAPSTNTTNQEQLLKQHQATKPGNQSYRSSIACFYCDRQGHKAHECYAKKKAMSSTAAVDVEVMMLMQIPIVSIQHPPVYLHHVLISARAIDKITGENTKYAEREHSNRR